MTPEKHTVRQWQSLYQAGVFEGRKPEDSIKAGWLRYSCRFDALPGRLRQMAPLVTRIRALFLLDHYNIWFENICCPNRKAVYDRILFQSLDAGRKGLSFHVDFKNPDEPDKWTLHTERFGPAASEYCCTSALEMAQYINGMAHELKHGIQPSFLAEKAAAVSFIQDRTLPYLTRYIRRVGDHSYSFLDRDSREKTVNVAGCREEIPPGFQAFRVREIHGLYVYCPADMEKAQPAPLKAGKKSNRKRKELQR